ncbi:MAG TPA: MXAN_5187 C-terminal domain-containing protein [Pyrinomonadaceae bacterium]|nr:MXAN_5187 C-terminal domain-containing protein [Pyrinomonadaceae bacterium]
MPIRENRWARAKEQRKQRNKQGFAFDEEPTVEEQLTRLEEDIRKLKIEFDIYFNGAAKRPPYDTKNRVEAVFKRLADDRTLTYANRFRLNTLTARYTAFRDLWRRTMQGREEGRDPLSQARAQQHEEHKGEEFRSTVTCSDAHSDVQSVRELYDALVEAKRRCNEPVDDLSFPRFHHLIASKTDSLKERLNCDRVKFSVDVEGGRVNFKAKADND